MDLVWDLFLIGLGMGLGLAGPMIAVYVLIQKWEEARRK